MISILAGPGWWHSGYCSGNSGATLACMDFCFNFVDVHLKSAYGGFKIAEGGQHTRLSNCFKFVVQIYLSERNGVDQQQRQLWSDDQQMGWATF